MSFEKGDTVVLNDKHSDFDGELGEITRVSETMFGDENYTVSFADGQEAGIPADSLAEAEDEELEAAAGADESTEE